MNKKRLFITTVLSISILCIIQWSCQPKKSNNNLNNTIPDNYFGKTRPEAYTPEIRVNMEKLYHDKFGLFVHWGPYAQLAGIWKGKKEVGEWIMNTARIPIKEYEEKVASQFRPDGFNAKSWVDAAEFAGMKFIVMTAKQHGFLT